MSIITEHPKPLEGVRVLELGTLIAGPFAGRMLADFGAEVLKIENPEGGDPLRQWGMPGDDGDSLWSSVQSRGKKSIALDLRTADGQQTARALAMTSDILIENFRPGRLEEWGLDPADLCEANQRLIVVRVSGFGQTGPLRDQPGFGTIAEAAAGLRYITGEPDRPPTRVGLSLGDSLASLHALVGALMALIERDRSGMGQVVDVGLTDAVFNVLEGILPEYSYHGAVRERTGNIAHNSAPTNAYMCADQKRICIGANSTGIFFALMSLMGRDDLRNDPRLATNRGRVLCADELDEAIEAWTSQRDSGELLDALRERRIPASKISSIADIVDEPHFHRRDLIVEVTDSRLSKPILVPGVVPRLSRTPGGFDDLGPPVGAHNGEIAKLIAEYETGDGHRGRSTTERVTVHRPAPTKQQGK